MNTHKNARLTFARRLELADCVLRGEVTLQAAATRHGVSLRTARKWMARYQKDGLEGLHDRSSKPHRSPKTMDSVKVQTIIKLRRNGLTMSAIAIATDCSVATVSRVCGPAGLSRLPQHSFEAGLHEQGGVVPPRISHDNRTPRPAESAEDRAELDSSQTFPKDTDRVQIQA